jgi:hypothetical protein
VEQHWLESFQVLNLFGKSPSLDDLIARKKYTQAVVVMREQFRRKSPDAPARQQFAELLILADRRGEAIPILLGLADEHLRFGFIDKAKDALGRIEQLESGRPDVAQRLRRIAGLEQTPTETRLAGKPRLAAKNDRPEPRAAAEATVLGAHETENEPAVSEEWDTDLSAPIEMVLEPPTLDREEPEGPKDDPIEVVPEPLEATADVSDCDDPIPVELTAFDLFPVGDAVLVNPAPRAEREAPVSRPIRRRASAPLSR